MKMKRLFVLGLLVVMAVSAFGFQPVGVHAASPVQIDFWGGWTGPDGDVMRGLVEKFNKEHPGITVNLMTLQWTPLFSKFIIEAKGGNPPDVLAMHPFELGQFASMGVLDAKQVKSVKVKKADYTPNIWQGSFYSKVQYAVPLDFHTHALYYNKELLDKAGVASAPQNLEEFIKAGQKLTIDKNGKNAGEAGFDPNNVIQYGLGMNMNHHAFYQWFALMYQQNEKTFNEKTTRTSFNNNKAAKAWGFLQDLVFKYNIVPKGEKAPFDDFRAGKVAMLIDGPWQLPVLEKSNLKFGVAPYPQIFQKKAVWAAAHILTFPVNKKADASRKAAAVQFVKWLSDNSAEWAKSGNIPSKMSTIAETKKLPGREAFINMMSYAHFLPPLPKAAQVFSSVAPSPILTAAQDTLFNNKKPLDIVAQMKKEMDSILSAP
ncbi:carbohydrate ABC transporter substrate-binding protein (CUT1 family) [Hydrogenispora ethanolica]|uniref:Carbohydrate ABC transporter substrate-binding protein (CUT1 family) n=1 Tax=Hydrogenispora ethanolica TaxID=1082276 RepID=A0A4R1RED0_HYDET|nr:ABC transporter substrate-binding protein [Hydrogenispora ethanolica]TCL64253.1 carbohydrate ABC transporter substrate-binding protein (CUT1 family) [Hydrogenispora ethanolica]